MSDYDEFAWFYDRYWAPDALTWELPVLEQLLLPELEPGASILDACCGAGDLAAALAGRGFSVTGVDLSPAMVSLARRKAPTTTVEVMDVRELRPVGTGTFAAVVSMFDSLNHLAFDELRQAIQGMGACLASGGRLVFDLNTRLGIEGWGPMAHADSEAAFIVEAGFDAVARRGDFCFVGFRQDGTAWRRIDTVLHQTWFDDEDVVAVLCDAGFDKIAMFDRAELLGTDRTGKKVVYTARKP